MARVRGSPRSAARHTGRQYGSGAQYVFDDPFTLDFGPWRGCSDGLLRGSYKEYLGETEDAVIRNGKLCFALIDSNATYTKDDDILGIFNFFVNNALHGIVIYEDATTGFIKVETYDGTTTTITLSSQASSGGRVHAVPWGDKIHIVQEDSSFGSNVLEYDVSAETFSTNSFPGTDPAEMIFFLDNNLVILTDGATDAVYIRFAVDSNPDDFTSIGSGDNPVAAQLGEPMGHGLASDSEIIMFEYGAVRMRPTGTLPAFQYDILEDFGGCPQQNAVVSDGNKVYFLDRSGYVRVTRGADPQLIGSQPSALDVEETTTLHYSGEAGFVYATQSAVQYTIDPVSTEIVGYTTSPIVQELMTKLRSNLTGGNLIATVDVGDKIWTKLLYTDGSVPTPAVAGTNVYTPYVDVGQEVEILYVDVFQTDPAEPKVLSVVLEDFRQGITHVVVGEKVEDHGIFRRYYLHAFSPLFRLKLVLEQEIYFEDRGVTKMVLVTKAVGETAKGLMYG